MPPSKSPSSSSPLHERFRKGSRILSAGLVALGVVILVGKATSFDLLTRLHPSVATMKANTALLFVLLGCGLFMVQGERRFEPLRRALAVVIVALAATTG